MKNVEFLSLLFSLMISGTSCSQNEKFLKSENELEDEDIYIADPTIFEHEGVYYLYGTKDDVSIEGEGFLVYTSKNLEFWEGPAGAKDGFALKKGDAFGSHGFWAPQVFEFRDKFYMAYTANENIAVAFSDSPLGPFTSSSKEALKAPGKLIDPFIFVDEDGKKYLYHVRLDDGNRIFVAEMDDELKSIKPETLERCISAEKQWENTAQVEWPVTEGPTVLKHEELYYLIYSANDFRNPDYAVGYASSSSPLGPWKKSDNNPIVHKDLIEESGPGHGDVIMDKDGGMQYVLHTHFSDNAVGPRKTAIVKMSFDGEGPNVDKETFRFLRQKSNQ